MVSLRVNKTSNGWTIETYAIHSEAMQTAEALHNREMRTAEALHNKEMRENDAQHNKEIREADDRRYGEVNVEKEKALKIKETADLTALELARESQVYKDERNDSMREQNLKETGVYATRDDLAVVVESFKKMLKPIEEFVSSLQGATKGSQVTMGKVFASIAAAGTIIGIIVSFSVFLTK